MTTSAQATCESIRRDNEGARSNRRLTERIPRQVHKAECSSDMLEQIVDNLYEVGRKFDLSSRRRWTRLMYMEDRGDDNEGSGSLIEVDVVNSVKG